MPEWNGWLFQESIRRIITCPHPGWIISRESKKNNDLRINGVIICAKLSNKAIGFALRNKYNVILCIDGVDETNQNILEVVYKSDIYVYTLGISWLTKTKVGKDLLCEIINSKTSNQWTSTDTLDQILVSLDKPDSLEHIISRFQNSVLWINHHNKVKKLCSSVTIALDHITLKDITKNDLDLLITTHLTSSIVNYCTLKKISLLWVNRLTFMTELSRELQYILSPVLYPLKHEPLLIFPRSPFIFENGLNGI